MMTCQPFSVAGKRRGADDERNLWPETIRVIRELRPRYAFLENVPGLLAHSYFGTVLGELAEAGYDAEWGCFTAAEVGASHKRERLFVLAHARGTPIRTIGRGLRTEPAGSSFPPGPNDTDAWARVLSEVPSLEPAVCRVVTGVPDRTHRLAALGDAVVPAQAAMAFIRLLEQME
jgi:DNA (cytosine-5)-methyltransferase 1